jgi:hypothetical protein
VWQRAHSLKACSAGEIRGVGPSAGEATVGAYGFVFDLVGRGEAAPGRAGEAGRVGDVAQTVLVEARAGDGTDRAVGAADVPQRTVAVRTSYTTPEDPPRKTSRSTFSVLGTDQERAAARPGMDVEPSDLSVAIACCRSSGAGRDQKGSRTERGGPAEGRKTIVRPEFRGEIEGQKWAPAERLSVSWTVPPRDAFRRYPRPGYVRREGLYSYWTLWGPTQSRFRGLSGPYCGRTQASRPGD